MAYKRQIDQLPIIPKDAKEFNVVCHYCIVGCGYHAYTWPANKQGGTAPNENKFGVDLSKQQPAETERLQRDFAGNTLVVVGPILNVHSAGLQP